MNISESKKILILKWHFTQEQEQRFTKEVLLLIGVFINIFDSLFCNIDYHPVNTWS